MKRSGSIILASVCLGAFAARGADATTPIDYTQRNTPYTPGTRDVDAESRKPEINETTQQKRVTPETIEKKPAAVGDRRAPIDMKEARDKNVIDKNTRKPEKREQPKSSHDGQLSKYSTTNDPRKPTTTTVSRYQDSLKAGNGVEVGKLPAGSKVTTTKINRFVFRKNGGELADSASRSAVTPAAGGSTLNSPRSP